MEWTQPTRVGPACCDRSGCSARSHHPARGSHLELQFGRRRRVPLPLALQRLPLRPHIAPHPGQPIRPSLLLERHTTRRRRRRHPARRDAIADAVQPAVHTRLRGPIPRRPPHRVESLGAVKRELAAAAAAVDHD